MNRKTCPLLSVGAAAHALVPADVSSHISPEGPPRSASAAVTLAHQSVPGNWAAQRMFSKFLQSSTAGVPTLERAGHEEKFDEIVCDEPLMLTVAVHVCGPVPSGGAIPVVFTVNCHCVCGEHVAPGFTAVGHLITVLSASCIRKLPAVDDVVGSVGQPSFTGAVKPLKPRPFSVAEAPELLISVALIVPHAYGIPLGSVIVPETSVNCAREVGTRNESTSNANAVARV